MTRSELTAQLRSLSAGAIASAILYAAEQASDDEIKQIDNFADILSFLAAHKDYTPSWCV